jgi:hypothetical protein
MILRRALLAAACVLPLAGGTAFAQFPPVPGQPQQGPPCMADFTKLRNDTETKGRAIQAASQRHAQPKEACRLFSAFQAAEAKMLKYAQDNQAWCGIPPQIIQQIKTSHDHTVQIRTKICKIAEAPQRPAGPSLSDALTGPVPDSSNIKPGRGGTFDTLTGSPVGGK